MKIKMSIVLVLWLGLTAIAAVPPGPVFETSKGWKGSGLSGHEPDKPTYWTGQPGAWAEWRPVLDAPVRARVSFYNIHHKGQNSEQAEFIIRYGDRTVKKMFNLPATEADWIVLGDFDFQALPHEGVRLIHRGKNMCRISAVRFEIFGTGKNFIQTFTVDEVNAGPLAAEMNWEPPTVSFSDLPELAETDPVRRLALRKIVLPDAGGNFRPDEAVTGVDIEAWLSAALEPLKTTGISNPGTNSMSAAEVQQVLKKAAEESGRQLIDHVPMFIDSGDNAVSRREAAGALWKFVETVVEAGAPIDAEWIMVFRDEFNGEALDERWAVHHNKPEGHIMSSRWKENIEVKDGLLRLLTKKEERGGKSWTSGKVWTKDFRPQYGYFEARMRLGTATGLNNAFWLMTPNKRTDPIHFEIDITEARHPNIHTMTVHNWAGEHKASGTKMYTEETLSNTFHVYGLEWSETELVWYFDGKEVRRTSNDYCHAPSPVLLSSAVGAFAGRVTDALDGTSQDIDWVRVYKRAGE